MSITLLPAPTVSKFYLHLCECSMALHFDSIAPIFEDTLCSQATIIGSFFFVLTGILCEAPMYLVSIVYTFITLHGEYLLIFYQATWVLKIKIFVNTKYYWWQFFKNWACFSKIKCFKNCSYQKWILTKNWPFLMSCHLLYLQSTMVFYKNRSQGWL